MKNLIGLCLISLVIAGCGTVSPVAQVPTEQPTQQPTQTSEPTQEPTEEPTLESAPTDAEATVPATEASTDDTLLAEGRASYLRNYCGSCHASEAANTRGTFGPPHDHMQEMASERITLESYTGLATTAEEYLRESLLEPRVYYASGYEATNHHMPAYTHLPEEEIDALIYFLLHQE